MPLTQERLLEVLEYYPNTGQFVWINCPRGSIVNGTVAGSISTGGYVSIVIDGTHYPAHRLAWLYVTGNWPEDLVDHIDGNPSNNEWRNLRPATKSQNGSNFFRERKGIRKRAGRNKWEARIRLDGIEVYLGSFETEREAREAFALASAIHRGDFANT